MTVKREQTEWFDATVQEITGIVRGILARGQAGYKYENIVEDDGGSTFKTTITPLRSSILSTEMQIHVDIADPGTKVVVKTKSQWFLLADLADFYGGYIRDVFDSIRAEKTGGPIAQRKLKEEINSRARAAVKFARWFGVILGLANILLFYFLFWRK